MRLEIFCLRDAAAESFLRPFFCANEAMARRAFVDLVSDRSHMCGQHPEDFALFYLGTWSDQSAEFKPSQAKQVVTGLEVAANQLMIAADQAVVNKDGGNGNAQISDGV